MCLLVVVWKVVPEWPLVLAANRDERYDRPADRIGILRETPRTLGGRDRLAGGTWLAVNEHGVVAGLTNQPAGGTPGTRRSRGEIPLAMTVSDTAAAAVAAFADSVAPNAYNPCWALAGDRSSLLYVNLTQSEAPRGVELPPGLHVLENRPLAAPSAKAQRVRDRLGDIAQLGGDKLIARLRSVLADHELTESPVGTDARSALVSRASACCVHAGGYGTRSAMLVRVPSAATAPPEVWSSDGPSCRSPLGPVHK